VTNQLKDFSRLAIKGLLATSAPAIVKGFMIEALYSEVTYKKRKRIVDVKLVSELITGNVSLWSLFAPDFCNKARNMLAQTGNMEWFTATWTIDAIKEEHPALASLFLSWRKAHNWLSKQVDEIKGNE